MGVSFDIKSMASTIAGAKDKALALAGEYSGLNGLIGGRVIPPIPPYPLSGTVSISEAGNYEGETYTQPTQDKTEYSIFGTPMVFPLSLKLSDAPEADWWLLPLEPIITLSGSNQLIRRKVAKPRTKGRALRGSIKELWSVDDYTINIDGMFTKVDEWTYPDEDVARLREIVEARKAIDVKCPLLEILGIGRMVIEKWDIPFTKGPENQAYRLTGYSDDDWDLFIKL